MITVLFVLLAAAIAPIAPEEDLLFGFDKATEADAWQAVAGKQRRIRVAKVDHEGTRPIQL